MIKGISHITFIVKVLDKTSKFFRDIFDRDIFDAKEVYSSGEKQFSLSRERFFLIDGFWICIMGGGSLSERTYNHIAFRVSEDDFDGYLQKIEVSCVGIKPARPRIEGEGRSVYFYDHDNHLFGLHTGQLETRLESYFKR